MKTEYHQTTESQDSTLHKPITPSDTRGASLGSGVAGPGVVPPCLLLSNISTENEETKGQAIVEIVRLLSPYWEKSAHTLHANIKRLIGESKSIGHLGFLTLTHAENITSNKESKACYDSFNTHFLLPDPRFGTKISVSEPQQRGAWHYHVLVQLDGDILDGFDFAAYGEWLKGNNRFRRRCPTGNPYLRQLWRDIPIACKKYGFGISEMMPIKSNVDAISHYLGGYLKKGVVRRTPEQKGVRLVNYSKGWPRNSPKFAWNTKKSAIWRMNVKRFADLNGCSDLYQLSAKLGHDWAYRYLEDIINVHEPWVEDRLTWRYFEDGTRADRETGEVQPTAAWQYEDRIFPAIIENQKAKRALLTLEGSGEIGWRDTQNQITKRKRKKEQAKINVHDAMINFKPTKEDMEEANQLAKEKQAFKDWLKTQPPTPF